MLDPTACPVDSRTYEELIPALTLYGIHEYVQNRTPTGDFLRGVLTNDLKKVMWHGDDNNLNALRWIFMYVYNQCPADCWGDKEKVQDWLRGPTKMTRQEARAIVDQLEEYISLDGFDNGEWHYLGSDFEVYLNEDKNTIELRRSGDCLIPPSSVLHQLGDPDVFQKCKKWIKREE